MKVTSTVSKTAGVKAITFSITGTQPAQPNALSELRRHIEALKRSIGTPLPPQVLGR